MKRISILIIALVVCASTLFAQKPENRTAKTAVVDALALLPAQTEISYTETMKTLVETGEEGVKTLGSMFTSVNNEAVNFALSGMAKYVTRSGNESYKVSFASSIAKEIAKTNDVEIKKYYLRLLAVCGGDEIIPELQKLLSDKDLQETVVETLIAFNSSKADKVLTEKMDIYPQMLAAHIIGQAEVAGFEDMLIGWYGTDDCCNLNKTVLYALGQTGSEASLKTLWAAAKVAGYTFDKNDALASLCTLLTRLADANPKLVAKEAKKLIKTGETEAMVAGVQLLQKTDKAAAKTAIIAAIKGDNKIYRNGVLNLVKNCCCTDLITSISGLIASEGDDVKVDLIRFFGANGVIVAYAPIFDAINSDNAEVSNTAMLAAAQLNGDKALIKRICGVMKSAKDETTVNTAATALSYLDYGSNYKAVFCAEVAGVVNDGCVTAKIAALNILATRKATSEFETVTAMLGNSNEEVSTTAYKTLAEVSAPANIEYLKEKLFEAKGASVGYLQDALYSAFAQLTPGARSSATYVANRRAGDKRTLLYSVFTRFGDMSIIKQIVANFPNASAEDKALSIAALNNWNGVMVYSYLTDLIEIANDADKAKLWEVYLNQVVKNSSATGENQRIFASNVLLNTKDDKLKERAIKIIGNTKSYIGLVTVAPYMEYSDANVKEAACQAVMKLALGDASFCGEEVIAMLKTCIDNLATHRDRVYNIQAINQHIATLETTDGYVSIFNGTDLSGWKGLVANPIKRSQMSSKTLAAAQKEADAKMNASWSVKNGTLYFNGKGDNICTDKMYGDFEMLVDWRLYKTGKEADAGIYLRGTPQVQIWDITRTNVGAEVGSGGLYNNPKKYANPTKVADNELGEWNTFYIKMVGDRVTVILNGVNVVDNVIMSNYWNKDIAIFAKEQIELQAHGSEVEYKNIYIREFKPVEPIALSAEEEKDGFQLLFDGVSMDQWQGNTTDYVSEDGCIVMYPSTGFGGNLYSVKEYDNFVLRFEFQLARGTNNGLGIRTPMNVDAAYNGMELQIIDNDAPVYANIEKWQVHGSVYGIYAAKRGFQNPVGEWNVQEVIADGNRIKITLNGVVITDVDIAEASQNNTKTLDGKSHPGLLNEKGYIGFLGHGSHVKFRNIRIKELK